MWQATMRGNDELMAVSDRAPIDLGPQLTIDEIMARIRKVAQRNASCAMSTSPSPGEATSEPHDAGEALQMQADFNQMVVSILADIVNQLQTVSIDVTGVRSTLR